MSITQTQYATTHHSRGADADLLLRLRIALSVKKRAGWHLVNVAVENGVVQLAGVVPSFYDRQMIAALVRHVAGVFGIEDKLSVGDPSIRQQITETEEITRPRNSASVAPLRNPFQHLPVLSETLDDVLAGHLVSVVPAI